MVNHPFGSQRSSSGSGSSGSSSSGSDSGSGSGNNNVYEESMLASGESNVVADQLLRSLTPATKSLSTLSIILSSSGKDAVTPGTVFALGVTVSNRGGDSVVAHIFLDGLPPPLRQWCPSLQKYLALAPGQSGEVLFNFQIPLDTLPNTYAYALIVDTPQQEDAPVRYNQQLQILPPIRDQVQASEPTFVVQPVTRTTDPAVLQPGATLPIQIIVYNRSKRVDRFRLACNDLPVSWFSVTYPTGTAGVGLVLEADSLQLNPGDQGAILLSIHPPLDALAGTYMPTLQLFSENNPDLGLLDVVYLNLLPRYLLQPLLRTVVGQVRQQPGQYEIVLENGGNTEREILLQAQSAQEDDPCTYTLVPEAINILPNTTGQVQLWVKPSQWWKRPWFGTGRVMNFRVELSDRHALPLQSNVLQGVLIWAARPWWQLLPLLLAGLGLLAALVWVIWWLFFRPPLSPQILMFFAEDSRYAASRQDTIHLGWQIEHPHRIQSLTITGKAPDGSVISGPLMYDIGRSLPPALQPFCTITRSLLTCRNVRTDARQPDTYTFELTVISKGSRRRTPRLSLSSQTAPVVIAPVPFPTVDQFTATQPAYLEAAQPSGNSEDSAADNAPERPANNSEIRLSWSVTQPENLQSLKLVGRTADDATLGEALYAFETNPDGSLALPPALQPFCQLGQRLTCIAVPTGITQAGSYTFELTAIPQSGTPEQPLTAQTGVVKIQPFPAQLLTFQVNGQDVQPKYLIPVDQGQPIPLLNLSWAVRGGASTIVELLPSPGNVPLQGNLVLPLSQQPGSTTLTLKISNRQGESVTRSVTFDVYDPTPTDPAAAVAEAIANIEAQRANAAAEAESGGDRPSSDAPSLTAPNTLSPAGTPPRLD